MAGDGGNGAEYEAAFGVCGVPIDGIFLIAGPEFQGPIGAKSAGPDQKNQHGLAGAIVHRIRRWAGFWGGGVPRGGRNAVGKARVAVFPRDLPRFAMGAVTGLH